MRARLGLTFILLSAAVLCFAAAYAQTPTATPSPPREGLVPAIVYTSMDVVAWLTGYALEYARSPLLTTIAGIMVIVLIVSLIWWMRRPRKPLETRSPM